MALSRKHYVAIAKRVADEIVEANELVEMGCHAPEARGQRIGVSRVAQRLASYFESENPKFDRERFLKACGVRS